MSTALAGREFVAKRFAASIDTPREFFAANADLVCQTCFEMAKRFHRGGRLLVFGDGRATTDAQHVAVEFVHPVIVGKRALPALALTNDIASVLGLAKSVGLDEIFARQVRLFGTPADIALGLCVDSDARSVARGLATGHDLGMLTIAMCGAGTDLGAAPIDHRFVVQSDDAHVVQEVLETTYHILWENVHVFFEHQGLLG